MGMPITIEIPDIADIDGARIAEMAFDYFRYVDKKFSVFKPDSEISQINRGEISIVSSSLDMQEILKLAEQTKSETDGYFDIIDRKGAYNPSGIVKGWAIWNATKIIKKENVSDFYVEAGGDIEVSGLNSEKNIWKVGIRNPFVNNEIVKVVYLDSCGIATSGTYIRGQHIYNPRNREQEEITDIISLTVIGPNVYEADRFATAAFAMGKAGIEFIEKQKDLEGYIIDCNGIATMTSGFERYTEPPLLE